MGERKGGSFALRDKQGIDIALVGEVLSSAGLFDPAWYVAKYPDVEIVGIPPLEHFLKYGFWMDRDPGPKFSRRAYASRNPDVIQSGLDPLIHYVKYGLREGRSASPVEEAPAAALSSVVAGANSDAIVRGHLDRFGADGIVGWAVDSTTPGLPVELRLMVDGSNVMRFSTTGFRADVIAAGLPGESAGFRLSFPRGVLRTGQQVQVVVHRTGMPLKSKLGDKLTTSSPRGEAPLPAYLAAKDEGNVLPVAVVVPVYNAPDAVQDCVESLAKTLPSWASALVIDDASPDPRITEILERFASDPRFVMLRNEENLGYTRTINRAIELAEGKDIVLLNSDTVVTPKWLENLRYAAYAQPSTATVTALSDNAGAFSVPEIGSFNPVPEHLSPIEAALAVVRAGDGVGLPVPTGNGFCLYIRRKALDAIGSFDESRFPRGYGEENDFCMRALHAGWRNIICDKSYVFHKRSQSFLEEKGELMEAGAMAVRERYPEYRSMITRFRDLEMGLMRGRIASSLEKARPRTLRPRVLYVISTQTGGTPQTNLDLMRAMDGRYECWLLRSDGATLTLMRLEKSELVLKETHTLRDEMEPFTHRSREYDRIVLDLLYRRSIDLLHIRHIAWHSLGLSEIARELSIPVVYSLHDFYSICYSVNLLGEGGAFLGTSEVGPRVNPLWSGYQIPDEFVPAWRKNMRRFLAACDAFVTTTDSAVHLVEEVYPELAGRIAVIPHGRNFRSFHSLASIPLRGQCLRVLVPGNISDSKGAALIESMVAIDGGENIEFHFLGKTISRIKGIGIHHGPYGRDEFDAKVREIAPHIGVVLSVWPETYCHTLTEMWACGLPVLGIDIGAVGDRIKATGGGWVVVPGTSPHEILEMLKEIRSNQVGFVAKLESVCDWQKGEGTWNNTAQMASAYRAIYRSTLQCQPADLSTKKIGLVVKDLRRGRFPPTAHIRVLGPMAEVSAETRFDTRRVSVEWLMAGGAAKLDGLIIQRDAVPAAQSGALIKKLQATGVPWIYEIDDALWDMADVHSDHQIDAAQEEAIVELIKGASLVSCSTEPLAEQLAKVARDVVVVPNAHIEELWSSPLDESYIARIRSQWKLSGDRLRMLYMGANSHAEDLDLVLDAVDLVLQRFPELEVVQIGGGRLLPMAREIERPESLFNYPDFVPWFRAIASTCSFAIAPLRDVEFNRYKSDIKYLDYAHAGLPAIFSDVGAYSNTVRHGQTGLLVANTSEEWACAIASMVQEGVLRQAIARDAKRDARLLRRDRVLQKWERALETAFGERYLSA